MMKVLLHFGTRKKADYLLYLAHALKDLKKRVLVVDLTRNGLYRNGYIPLDSKEYLYDFQGIDIMADTGHWSDIPEILSKYNEDLENYDVVLLDVDHIDVLQHDWPVIDDFIYVGDFERDHITQDVEMIEHVLSLPNAPKIRRITFASKFKMNANFIEVLIDGEVKWNSIHMLFEYDELLELLRLTIQHQQEIPFSKLNRQHKELINGYISELYHLHLDEIRDSQKSGNLFKRVFKKKVGADNSSRQTVPASDEYAFEKLK